MCNFKETYFGFKTLLSVLHRGPMMVLNNIKIILKWSQMVPPPIPIPIPGVSKSLLPGGKQIRKKKNTLFPELRHGLPLQEAQGHPEFDLAANSFPRACGGVDHPCRVKPSCSWARCDNSHRVPPLDI